MNFLNQLGTKIANIFGEPSQGIRDATRAQKAKRLIFDTTSIADILPYESFDVENGLFINQNSLGFVIELFPIFSGDTSILKILQGVIQEILEEGSSIQCLLWADHRIDALLKPWENSFKKTAVKEIAELRSNHFKQPSEYPKRMFKIIFSYSLPRNTKTDNEDRLRLAEVKSKLLRTLSPITLVYQWGPTAFLENIGGIINYSINTEVVSKKWNPCETLSDQLVSGQKVEVDEHYLTWKHYNEPNVIFKSFKVYETPDRWPFYKMSSLIGDAFKNYLQIKSPFFIHYGIHCPSQSKAEALFSKNSFFIENQGKSPALLRFIPELASELRECDYVRRSLKQGAKFVWTQMSTGFWAEDSKMVEAEQSIKGLYRSNEFKLMETTNIQLPHFLSILPMTWGEYVEDLKMLKLLKTTLTDECPNFMPIQGEWIGGATSGMLLTGRRGQIINWNQFMAGSLNYNCAILGGSGGGKSVFMQELLFLSYGLERNVFILDVGRSYEKMCELLSGQYLEFKQGINLCLNPFTHVPTDAEFKQSFSFLLTIIFCMVSPDEKLNYYDQVLIARAIKDVWKRKKNKATITDVANRLKKDESEDARRLGVMLTPYTKEGIYSEFFEGENNVDFSNPLVLIELEELKAQKDLQAVVLQIFIMTIVNKSLMGNREKQFIICIDEAWELLAAEAMGDFIRTLAKRVRKYGGSLMTGTQEIDDYFSRPGSKAAYTNSYWKIFLPTGGDEIQKQINSGNLLMDNYKLELYKSLKTVPGSYSEILITNDSGVYGVVRLFLDRFSGLLYSTKSDDFQKIRKLKDQGITTIDAIKRIINDT
ncbi:MAG: type IV secretion system protein TraC [Parachlamydiaceae bacterium]